MDILTLLLLVAPVAPAGLSEGDSGPVAERYIGQPEAIERSHESGAAEALYQRYCNSCHDGTDARAPARDVILALSPRKIYRALTDGMMKEIAQPLSDEQRRQLAEHLSLTRRPLDVAAAEPPHLQCDRPSGWFDYGRRAVASGWGIAGVGNERFIPAQASRLPRTGVQRLKLKWVFGFPEATIARAQPAIAGGALFVGSQDGTVYALDAGSGCLHWAYDAKDEVRTAIVVSGWQGRHDRDPVAAPLLYFGDRKGYVYAVNAVTGSELWKVRPEEHPLAIITGTPNLYRGVLYVAVSSKEEAMAGGENYRACCTFRGSVVALEAKTGRKLWQTYTIPVPAAAVGSNSQGRLLYGPSGASIYHTPSIDTKRQVLYVATDNNYTGPELNDNTIFAIRLDDGAVVWKRQTTGGNIFNYSCVRNLYSEKQVRFIGNCPDENQGHDTRLVGFGAPPVLAKGRYGREVLVAGQKNGLVWGLDPDTGAIIWQRSIAEHPANKTVSIGLAQERGVVFAGISPGNYDGSRGGPPEAVSELGIVALDAMTGAVVWRTRVADHCAREHCSGYYASLTAIPGVVFAAARDGFLRAYDSRSGSLLWELDSMRAFTTVNGTTALGGTFNGDGPVIANGNVYIGSGCGYAVGGIPGNVLLALSVDGR